MSVTSLVERYGRVSWAILDQILVSGASFVTTMLVARFLGKEEFGRFVLAWLAVWVIQNIQIAVITTPITTFATREPRSRRPAYFGAVWVQQAVFAVATTLLAYAFAIVSAKAAPAWRLHEIAVPLALVVLFGQIADIQRRYFYIEERAQISFAIDAARHGTQLVGLVVLLVAWPAKATLGASLGVIAAANLLGCMTGWLFMQSARFEWDVIKEVAQRHWVFSRWLLGSTLTYCARESFVSVMVGSLLGLTEVGVLRAMQQLVMTINIPLYVMHNIVPARASLAYSERGFTGLWSYLQGFALKYFFILCSALIVIGIFGEPLLKTIYGPAFSGYGGLVLVYAIIMIIFLIRDFVAIVLKTTENTDFDFYAGILGACFCFVLLVPLVKKFGLAGALLSELVMQVGMLVVMAWGLRTYWHHRSR